MSENKNLNEEKELFSEEPILVQEKIKHKNIKKELIITLSAIGIIILFIYLNNSHKDINIIKQNKITAKFNITHINILPIKLFNINNKIEFQSIIESIKVNDVFLNNLSGLFEPNETGIYIVEIQINKKLTSIEKLFSNCDYLISVDLSQLITNEITSFHGLFENCRELKEIKLTYINTPKITNMSYMFFEYKSLISVNYDNNTNNFQNLKDISEMFAGCFSLKEIDLSFLSNSPIENMFSLFHNCRSLTKIKNMEFLNTTAVTNMSSLFNGCISLKEVNISKLNLINVTDISKMFKNCLNLTNVNDINKWNTIKLNNISCLLCGCKSLEKVNLSSLDMPVLEDMSNTFSDCSFLKEIILPGKNLTNVKNISYMFNNCLSLITIINLNTLANSKLTDISYLFNNCKNITNIDLSFLDTKNIINMSHLFSFCVSLLEINLSNFVTSNVIDMSSMFQCVIP